MKKEGARVLIKLYIKFSYAQRAANSVIGDEIWQKFKLFQAFIVVLVTCKNDEDPFKKKALGCSQHFSHYKSMENFSDIQGQLTPQTRVRSCRISNQSKLL